MTFADRKKAKTSSSFMRIGLFLVFLILLLLFAQEIQDSIQGAIRLVVMTVIPSLFPFIILSDYFSGIEINTDSGVSRCFERIFGMPSQALTSVITGLLCGFPLGIKSASSLYDRGVIDDDELVRICGCANNPSLGFVISSVGLGMRGSSNDGWLLFISVTLSSLLLLIFTRRKPINHNKSEFISRQSFDLSKSIKDSASVLTVISSYIILFSALLGVIKLFIKSKLVLAIAASLLEVSSGMKIVSSTGSIDYQTSMLLSAFGLGFSGFSVHLQSLYFIPSRLVFLRYLFLKMITGACAALIMSAILILL